MENQIIDTHVHLYDVTDPHDALGKSFEAGVTDVIVLGVDLASNIKHLEFRGKTDPRVHLAFGLHPGNITSVADTAACLQFMREHVHGSVAIGEAGLDFWYKWVRQDDAKKQAQREAFRAQIDLAAEFDLPIVIHARGTWRECLDTAKAAGIKKADFHWYSGPVDVLQGILDAGYLVSVSPALEYSPDSRRTAEYVPLDRLLIETDTPVKVSLPDGTRVPSTPRDVWRTLKALCAVKKIAEDLALPVLNANARAFFNLDML
ncbi:MAG: TatD family hydrolase [Candidatus Omnitrophica bacterium]|nr:TatD family hydrolase [Candidatus Omnitrophota bacterium]